MMQSWQVIAESLRAEIAEFGGLLRLFEQQQQALFARDPETVLRLSAEIEAQARALNDCRQRREQLVADYAVGLDQPATATLRSLLPFVDADARPLLDALINEVNRLIHRVRRLTRQNHTLLARTIESHQETLRALRPDAFVQTYTAGGRKAIVTNARPATALQAAG